MVRTHTVALTLGLAILAGCSSGPPKIVVGSKNFTEQIVLGEIFAQQIERRLNQPVDRKLNLGGTLLAHEALVAGSIDLYPEYTGTALTAVLKQPPSANAAQVLDTVAREYQRQWKLQWLPPLGFNDTFAMVVRGETARAEHLATISDAAARREPWKLGVGYEFLQRPDGLAGLVKTYGLRVDGQPVSMDLGLLYRALEGRQVDMAAANSTDGQLQTLDVVVLSDDKNYFPPYQCAIVARDAALADHDGLRAALVELSGKIDDAAMRRLNYEVQGKRRPVSEVAAEFLKGLGR